MSIDNDFTIHACFLFIFIINKLTIINLIIKSLLSLHLRLLGLLQLRCDCLSLQFVHCHQVSPHNCIVLHASINLFN